MGLLKTVFFSSQKHALPRRIDELRPKMSNVFFLQILFFHFDPPGRAQLFKYYSFKSKFDLPYKF